MFCPEDSLHCYLWKFKARLIIQRNFCELVIVMMTGKPILPYSQRENLSR
ncbi:hypothetical protein SEHO0A_02916 [Salmonella enterica subsp. houtenae str. ATCC BAA-1581]|nr:hypothetical protein SEHO0A_02916 [Salmonella enterica subsp. houtenae str. ATCC BAA-1581]